MHTCEHCWKVIKKVGVSCLLRYIESCKIKHHIHYEDSTKRTLKQKNSRLQSEIVQTNAAASLTFLYRRTQICDNTLLWKSYKLLKDYTAVSCKLTVNFNTAITNFTPKELLLFKDLRLRRTNFYVRQTCGCTFATDLRLLRCFTSTIFLTTIIRLLWSGISRCNVRTMEQSLAISLDWDIIQIRDSTMYDSRSF